MFLKFGYPQIRQEDTPCLYSAVEKIDIFYTYSLPIQR